MSRLLVKLSKIIRCNNIETQHATADLETSDERRKRWRSIRIMYFVVFSISVGHGLLNTSIWPYLKKLDTSASKEFLGVVVAAGWLGQMLFSPVVGYWSSYTKSARMPLCVSMPLAALAGIGYGILEIFPTNSASYWMVVFRFLIGVSKASSSVVCRSYVAEATTLAERTGAISMIAIWLILGNIIGNVLQGAVTPLGDAGIPLFAGAMSFNMYNAPVCINLLIVVVVFVVLVWPKYFNEWRIAIRESVRNQQNITGTTSSAVPPTKPDLLAIWSLVITAFFINFSVFEMLGTMIIMDQFAWSKEDTVKFMTFIMTCGSVANLTSVLIVKPLCRRFDERSVLLYCGYATAVVGLLICIPLWSTPPPPLLIQVENENSTSSLGCPVASQSWCEYTPAMTVIQVVIGHIVFQAGMAFGRLLSQAILSKVVGPTSQGSWIGIFMAFLCFSRVISPVLLSRIYVWLGPAWTFSLSAAILALCSLWLWLVKDRLVPLGTRKSGITTDLDIDNPAFLQNEKYTKFPLQ